LDNTTITGDGTISVENVMLQCANKSSTGADCTLNIGKNGRLRIDNNLTFTVKNFHNSGTVCEDPNDLHYGKGVLKVTGTLTPGNNIRNLHLESGATITIAETVQTVSKVFSATGTITLDASAVSEETLHAGDVAVLTVPAAQVPADVKWLPVNSPIKNVRTKWKIDESGETQTLYFGKVVGLKLIIK
jgi:hypothetical protein